MLNTSEGPTVDANNFASIPRLFVPPSRGIFFAETLPKLVLRPCPTAISFQSITLSAIFDQLEKAIKNAEGMLYYTTI